MDRLTFNELRNQYINKKGNNNNGFETFFLDIISFFRKRYTMTKNKKVQIVTANRVKILEIVKKVYDIQDDIEDDRLFKLFLILLTVYPVTYSKYIMIFFKNHGITKAA